MHEKGSLFSKTVRMVLTPPQLEAWEKLEAERARRRYEALVQAAVMKLDNQIPLTADQRRRLLAITLARTQPPRRHVNSYSQFGQVLGAMASVPEAEMKPIFSEAEWTGVKQILDAYRGQYRPDQVDDGPAIDF
ncbi:MAG TPA: hypothetical protein PKI08_06640 [Aquaticitalea sp.]|nr:hypothetical protein [Aquaticitalea sp.]